MGSTSQGQTTEHRNLGSNRDGPRTSSGPRGVALTPPTYGVGVADHGVGVADRPNHTGLPDAIKTGVEQLSGIDLGDVRVHRDSAEPAKHRALAFARGPEIHVGPGQDQQLAHEAWHVVQQKQGRVAATRQFAGAAINDEPALEHEADVMSRRVHAFASNPTSIAAPRTAVGPGSRPVMQLALATVDPQTGPIRLKQEAEYMKNPGQPEGDDVSNAVGFTDVLNRTAWGDLGKSPRNYWRAHAYAKSFGGGGGPENVAWWPAAQEDDWTAHEQKVRGGGLNPIARWKPNTRETGHYTVTRVLKPAVDVNAAYLVGLEAGAAWGLADARPAWVRALATPAAVARPDRFPAADFGAQKLALAGLVTGYLNNWLNAAFGVLGTHLIASMRMQYVMASVNGKDVAAAAAADYDGGADRDDVDVTLAAPDLDPATIGLKNEPKKIWEAMFNRTGSFANGPAPLGQFKRRVDSRVAHDNGKIELAADVDGFGVGA